jgi:hypothetical protein
VAVLTASTTSHLLALLDRYGVEWCRGLLRQWHSNDRDRAVAARVAWVKSALPELCRHLCTGSASHGIELAEWLAAEQWAWIVERAREIQLETSPTKVVPQLVALNGAILSVIQSGRLATHRDLHGEVLQVLTSSTPGYPVRAIVDLLETAHHRLTPGTLPNLGLQPLHAHAVRYLTARLTAPPRTADDWSITAPIKCPCTLCASLARFLRAPDQVRLDWPLAKDRRAHIHGTIDLNDLPVSHVTRRIGRPFTLVLEKTVAVFSRDAAERGLWENDLKWLRTTAEAF